MSKGGDGEDVRPSHPYDEADLDRLERAVVITDAHGVIEAWNAAAEKLYGWTADEVRGRHVIDVLGPGPEPDAAHAALDHLAQGTPRATEFTAQHRDGRSLIVDVVTVPLIEDGKVVAFAGFSSDRSAERAVAAELRASRERLEMTTAQGRVGTWRTSILTGRTSWDAGLERIFGLESGAFGGGFEDFLALVHPEDRDALATEVRAALQSADEYVLEHRAIVDGQVRWIEGRGRVIRDEDGSPRHTVGVAIDVTERKRAELALAAQSASLQRRLLPSSLPNVAGLDLAARYVPAGELEVGGDWYDVLDLGRGRVAIAVGDVMGRGVEAASVMGQVRVGLRAYTLEQLAPSEVLSRLGRLVASLETESFSTLVFGVIDLEQSTLSWATAGHPPPLVRHADGRVAVLTGTPSPPVGVEGERPTETSVRLGPGDILVAYTDGLVERQDLPISEGIARLASHLATAPTTSASEVVEHLLRLAGGGDDDVAILAALVLDGDGGEGEEPLAVHEWTFPAVPASSREARERVVEALLTLDAPAVSDTAALVVAELATNAVIHARTPFVVRIILRRASLRIEVIDEDIHLPTVRHFSRTATSGRGLRLVESVAEALGASPTAEGKVVWVDLALDAAPVSPLERPRTGGSTPPSPR